MGEHKPLGSTRQNWLLRVLLTLYFSHPHIVKSNSLLSEYGSYSKLDSSMFKDISSTPNMSHNNQGDDFGYMISSVIDFPKHLA